jgi:hypothetical protein
MSGREQLHQVVAGLEADVVTAEQTMIRGLPGEAVWVLLSIDGNTLVTDLGDGTLGLRPASPDLASAVVLPLADAEEAARNWNAYHNVDTFHVKVSHFKDALMDLIVARHQAAKAMRERISTP